MPDAAQKDCDFPIDFGDGRECCFGGNQIPNCTAVPLGSRQWFQMHRSCRLAATQQMDGKHDQ